MRARSYGVTGAYLRRQADKEWSLVPRWHWRYWFGYRMRLQNPNQGYDPEWNWIYRTFGQHARAVLEEQCNGQPARDNPTGASPNYYHYPH